jgi:cysteine desulfurase / selenocysteine lyase
MAITMPETAATKGQHLDASPIDGAAVRADFPVLNQPPRDGRPPLAFLDSAASSQKPAVVIEALDDYYRRSNANIHRGVYELSEIATAKYEAARKTLARFINARSARECVFVRNTTEAINLVAQTWGRANLRPGDLIVGTVMEHHSNLVPWQLVTEATGARLAYVRLTGDGRLDLDHFNQLMAEGPKLVAFTHVSNSLGTVNPAKDLIARAHAAGAVVLLDGAQSVPHLPTDVRDLDCDFLAFSGHKMLGPMGASVLYGKKALLDAMPPFLGGGSMIRKVALDGSTWADVPAKFEAGTPAVGDAIALAVAAEYLQGLGMDRVRAHEREIVAYALMQLVEVDDVVIHGPDSAEERSGVVSFSLGDVHPHDVAAILDEGNVAVRAGHHCTQPLMRALGVVATTRASFYVYNTFEDVDRLVAGLHRVNQVLGRKAGASRVTHDGPCRARWEQANDGPPAEVPDVG